MVGADADGAAAIDGTLRGFGSSATRVDTPDEALALLASGAFGFLVVTDVPRAELDELVRRLRPDPSLARLPILVLTPPRDSEAAPAAMSHLDGGCELQSSPAILLAARAPAELLASQLWLLLELHRARLNASDVEAQLGQARLDLRGAADTNAELAEQARQALGELVKAQTQLVQAAKLAALGELVAGVAHEINNPLSFSMSHLGTLRRGVSRSLERLGELDPASRAESARLEERLGGIALGLDRIKSLVIKLQTFSRLDDGTVRATNVADAVGTVLAILHHRTHERIQVTTEFGSPETIECQTSLIDQCVMNLIVNAIDAIEPLEAEGRIHIRAGADGEFYLLSVVDNGHGIAADIQARIFEPFFTTKAEGKGTGLGLSIAVSVVEKHGGTLELSSAEGGGTQALIRLPLGRVSANSRPAASQH